ncbi:hypothetical protein PG996_004811 [Apiospora saccharicola]|uniref:Uncharacterized protein n=1 Tax=Apiospora saccharicola TaxID=335842 RepID=A0ABR1W577_9PEZI
MSERANSRERHSRRNRRHRPRNQVNTRAESGIHQTNPADGNRAAPVIDTTIAQASATQTTSALTCSTPPPWIDDSGTTNNGPDSRYAPVGAQDASSLQSLAGSDANSNQWTDTTGISNSQVTNGYEQEEQAQWYALNNYRNAPPREDVWSPWVVPFQEEVVEENTVVGEDKSHMDEGHDESSQNGS